MPAHSRSRSAFHTTTLVLACLLALAGRVASAQPASTASTQRTLLAVFAHPDDETIAAPLLAHYAHAPNTRVVIAIVTNGAKGVTPFAGIPPGEQLAAARTKEATCSCAALGAQPPVLLGFPDGGLADLRTLTAATTKLRTLITEIRPDAIVTWGPEGGYGHADHRLVSAMVTEIVQAGDATPRLYYAGLPKSRLQAVVKATRFPAPFKPVLDDALHVRVPYTAADAARARRSLECHVSQFTPETMAQLSKLSHDVQAGAMHLRHWMGGGPQKDLFER